jgi:glycosyltransferase involved in cell wall biosynthesis
LEVGTLLSMKGVSVVIPVYNSTATLRPLTQRLVAIFTQLAVVYEVIFVNDGSRDASWEQIEALSGEYAQVRGFDLLRNYGQHNALLCGIRAARYEVIVTMDDDLQHPPEEIPTLLAKLAEGYDVVYGAPRQKQQRLWRKMAAFVTRLVLQSAMGAEIARMAGSFRVLRAPIREAFADYRSPSVYLDALLTWGATRFAAVQVRHDRRAEGRSQYTVRKLLRHALNMMTGFSTVPLQVASLVGFVFTLFGMVVFLYVVGRYLIAGTRVPGFPFLASLIAIFSGTQLFTLGIMGEYLARMHLRMMERPSYVVRTNVAADSRDCPHTRDEEIAARDPSTGARR